MRLFTQKGREFLVSGLLKEGSQRSQSNYGWTKMEEWVKLWLHDCSKLLGESLQWKEKRLTAFYAQKAQLLSLMACKNCYSSHCRCFLHFEHLTNHLFLPLSASSYLIVLWVKLTKQWRMFIGLRPESPILWSEILSESWAKQNFCITYWCIAQQATKGVGATWAT